MFYYIMVMKDIMTELCDILIERYTNYKPLCKYDLYDNLYGTTYRNITDILFSRVTVFDVLKYRIEFWFDGSKKDVIWFDQSATRRYCYIQLGEKQYNYEEIKKNEHKFMLELNNELTKTALETLE